MALASSLLRAAARRSLAPSTSSLFLQATVSGSINPSSLSRTSSVCRAAFFSSDSHDDFAPKKAVIEDDDEATQMIKDHVGSNRVMVYMKGNPSMPMCGFSAKVIKILQDENADFSSVNVLDYPTIREGVKKFAGWPTIPQLYVEGEFIGGCDIITSMHESGELAELLKAEVEK